jgi:hypothetical protein
MFWGKKSAKEEEKKEKLSGPRVLPGLVQNYLIAERKMAPDLVVLLKAVVHKSTNSEATVNIRVFDNSEAIAKKVQVKDYISLNECPDLIIYEGWFDEGAKQVKLEEKKKGNWDTPIFTEEEIQQKIEALKEPGESVLFYQARGSNNGGPLGMGASIIELNPSYPGKKQKKYNIYTTDVVDMQPANERQKLFVSNKLNEVAQWVKAGHHNRMY